MAISLCVEERKVTVEVKELGEMKENGATE